MSLRKRMKTACWKSNRHQPHRLLLIFLHYHDSYKTNNKLLQILEVYPESHERMKNYIISVMRGQILVKKGV